MNVVLLPAKSCSRPVRFRLTGRRERRGMSLLEVILSIAILGTSLVVVGQLLELGYRSARQARIRTQAVLHVDSIMAELAAGAIDVKAGGGDVPGTTDWSYRIDSGPGIQLGLLSVTVTVTQSGDVSRPLSLSVVRFLPDPDYEPESPLE